MFFHSLHTQSVAKEEPSQLLSKKQFHVLHKPILYMVNLHSGKLLKELNKYKVSLFVQNIRDKDKPHNGTEDPDFLPSKTDSEFLFHAFFCTVV